MFRSSMSYDSAAMSIIRGLLSPLGSRISVLISASGYLSFAELISRLDRLLFF